MSGDGRILFFSIVPPLAIVQEVISSEHACVAASTFQVGTTAQYNFAYVKDNDSGKTPFSCRTSWTGQGVLALVKNQDGIVEAT
jgi:hypothetical protein